MAIIDFIQSIIDAIGIVGSDLLNAISGFVDGLGELSSGSSVTPDLPDAEVPGEDAPVDETPVDPEVPGEDAPIEETPEV